MLANRISNIDRYYVNQELAANYGLSINRVSWDDTGRDKNSSNGKNISDSTLNVSGVNMPIIRKSNYLDMTADLPNELFTVTVGNEGVDAPLTRISLKDFIGEGLFKPRDSHLLASAQCCVLPLTYGEVEFCPKMYNYQGSVLTIVSTNEGTSCHVMTQEQFLYFNRGGRMTKYLAKRLSQDRKERGVSQKGVMTTEENDRNVILIYQIPLVTLLKKCNQNNKCGAIMISGGLGFPLGIAKGGIIDTYEEKGCSSDDEDGSDLFCDSEAPIKKYKKWYLKGGSDTESEKEASDDESGFGLFDDGPTPQNSPVHPRGTATRTKGKSSQFKPHRPMENAMLRASEKDLGSFEKVDFTKLKRDERFPIRVTYQFYRVTDNSNLTEDDFSYISEKIESVYKLASSKGSLVINDSNRVTETTPLRKLSIVSDSQPLFSSF